MHAFASFRCVYLQNEDVTINWETEFIFIYHGVEVTSAFRIMPHTWLIRISNTTTMSNTTTYVAQDMFVEVVAVSAIYFLV
jgi:hypothetical protein